MRKRGAGPIKRLTVTPVTAKSKTGVLTGAKRPISNPVIKTPFGKPPWKSQMPPQATPPPCG